MDIFKGGSRPTQAANPEYFSGVVYSDPIVAAPEPARVRSVCVTFMPGGRTAWHTHPLGQTLYVLRGVGRVQKQGEPVREIRAGDTVWIAPDEVHWHGAAPDTMMVHVAVQEAQDGTHIVWMEHVSEEEYRVTPSV
ncbi:MAG: cupin domain-containing protein [Pseudomonadota bacterium]